MTKKWKWPSMAPCMRCTTTAEEVSRPTHTAIARLRRENRARVAMAAQTRTGPASTTACHSGLPASSPQAKSPTTCAHRSRSIQAWRRRHTAGGRVRPLGRVAPRRENALTARCSAVQGLSLRSAKHARVVGQALGHPLGVEVLEQRLGELARGPSSSRRRARVIAPSALDDRLDAARDGRRARRGGRTSSGRRARRARRRAAQRARPRRRGRRRSAARGRRRAGAPRARARRRRAPAAAAAGGGAAGAAAAPARARARRERRRSSRASTSGRGPWRRARGSSTTPPPRVSGGAIERTTTRSPARASSGRSRRSCQSPSPSVGHARRRLARAVVDVHAHPVAARRAGRARASSDARRRAPRRRGDDVAARDLARARRPARLSATRWPARGALDGLVVDLDAAHAHAARRAAAATSTSPRRDRARPQRAGDDRARAADGERRGRRAARGSPPPSPRGRAGARRRASSAARSSSTPVAGARRARHDLDAAAAARAASRSARAGSARSAFVTATTPSSTPSAAQHRGVLARLGHHAVVGGDDHQVEVDAGRPGDHRAHEALVAGHVDDRQPRARGQRERREAELDRDPARASPRAGGRCRRR